MRVLGIGGGGLGNLRPWVGGEAGALSRGQTQPTGSLILPDLPTPMTVWWKRVISGGALFIVQPQDLKSQPEVGSSSPLPRLGRGRGSPHRPRKDVPGPGPAPDRQIIGPGKEQRAGHRSPVREGRMGAAHTPAWGPIDASLPRAAAVRPLPELPGICQSHLVPSPSLFSAQRTQQIPRGLRVVGWGWGGRGRGTGRRDKTAPP